jgi:hypothetical protein
MAGAMTGSATTGHIGRVTKTDEFFLSEAVGWRTQQFCETLNV